MDKIRQELKRPMKEGPAFRMVALINIATIVLFRILLLCWMAWWITANRCNLSFTFLAAGSVGVSVVLSHSMQLFRRSLNQDFSSSQKKDDKKP